jgi:deoxyribodipyrimidine photo-lyase
MVVPKSLPSSKHQRVLYLHWFRLGDLRLHDNPALCQTIANAKKATTDTTTAAAVLPIFIFDTTTIFGHHVQIPFEGGWKCSPRRAKFILESVQDLQQSLEQQGSGLFIQLGTPEQVMRDLLQSIQTYKSGESFLPKVTCQDEVCSEERAVEQSVRRVLHQYHPQATLETVWGSTLYHVDELPYDKGLIDMPNVFTPFRTKVEKHGCIHPPLPTPTSRDWKTLFPTSLYQHLQQQQQQVSSSSSSFPTLLDLGYTPDEVAQAHSKDDRAQMEFHGGEHQALQRVQDYIWTKDRLKEYYDTRNGMLHADDSSKLSPWLAHGCLSPRMVAQQCQKYEQERVANKSTYWLVFELLWRDFFKFFALKHGNDIFQLHGITSGSNQQREWGYNPDWIRAWKEGRTGYPLVDANMRELAATGYMSNRGRQNVCSFLALDLAQDWRYGAYYFESVLLDYDVYSNYGNWCSGAGMTGGRINRFNIIKQSKDYDQHGEYLRHWLPELQKVPTEFVHEPWKMNQFQQMEHECQLGVDYPNPIIPPSNFRSVPPAADRSRRQPTTGSSSGGGGRRGSVHKSSRQPATSAAGASEKENGSGQRRTSGQRQDMKSLKVGTYRIGDSI